MILGKIDPDALSASGLPLQAKRESEAPAIDIKPEWLARNPRLTVEMALLLSLLAASFGLAAVAVF